MIVVMPRFTAVCAKMQPIRVDCVTMTTVVSPKMMMPSMCEFAPMPTAPLTCHIMFFARAQFCKITWVFAVRARVPVI